MNLNLPPGSIFDSSFRIEKQLGEGGMGSVFLAEQLDLKRLVALKILRQAQDQTDGPERFLREARALSSLRHKYIVEVFQCRISRDGYFYMVMEYVAGRQLNELILEQGRLSWQVAVKIVLQVCQAIACAHKAGIIHRDLKPQNIILSGKDEYQVKVIDFGLAAMEAARQKLTRTGTLLGSLPYMSPEQCRGLKTDQRSDIYSAACVLYECIAGKTPFPADNAVRTLYMHVHEMPASLQSFMTAGQCPDGLETVLFKALAKDRKERYQDIDTFARHLQLVLEQRSDELPAGLFEKRKPADFAGTLAVLFLVLVFSGIAFCLCYRSNSNFAGKSATLATKPRPSKPALTDSDLKKLRWSRLEPLLSQIGDDRKCADILLNWLSLHKGNLNCREELDATSAAVDHLKASGRTQTARQLLSKAVYSPTRNMQKNEGSWTKLAQLLIDMDNNDIDAQKRDLEFLKTRINSGHLGDSDGCLCLTAVIQSCKRLGEWQEGLKWTRFAEKLCKDSSFSEIALRLPEFCLREAQIESHLAHYQIVAQALDSCRKSIQLICADEMIDADSKFETIHKTVTLLSEDPDWYLARGPLPVKVTELALSCLNQGLTLVDSFSDAGKGWLLYNRANFALLNCLYAAQSSTGFKNRAPGITDRKVINNSIQDFKAASLCFARMSSQELASRTHRQSDEIICPMSYDDIGHYGQHGAGADRQKFQQRNCLIWIAALEHISGQKAQFEQSLAQALSIKLSPDRAGLNQGAPGENPGRLEAALAAAGAFHNFALVFKNACFYQPALLIFRDSKLLYESLPDRFSKEKAQLQASIQDCQKHLAQESSSLPVTNE